MKLPRGAEWMAHCLVALAVCDDVGPVPRRALSEMFDISEEYLTKQLQLLVKQGVVASAAGQRGGYRLSKPATEVTLLDVLNAIQGDAPLFNCEDVRCRGIFEPEAKKIMARGKCGIHKAMLDAEKEWRKSLRHVTIDSLTEGVGDDGARTMREFVASVRQ
ncbi:transcriptional regulator, BadM/Rrf2 family [Micrococcus luteus]|uniref:Transcriptional regulator, BadM/Rrf2 family n=1 Tax=Micrococcus luteus TaxID=1270 RepID=A0ABD7MDE7_MICLU|nr:MULTISPECIES: Rrf2 family transcriptional regulator [Micrococcaceae]MBF0744444.1 Rrf2 family transcriptional regulator [Micrococcus yunnanensis]MCR4488656.1 Rrf2 family transcriptional regulator [Micrococcus luteus]MCV7472745.1 Rrf2 family transcriptional regulator [Micrococcus luteus]MCV7487771.1 Rrf2 family transcriptional regulator [Micrococcus luteus]MCV7598935.1 Rrf2 family transcriptional regulator [Micrococcus luteus]